MIQGADIRGRQREKLLDGLTKWLHVTERRMADALKASKDLSSYLLYQLGFRVGVRVRIILSVTTIRSLRIKMREMP